jgi:hypothetical protein
MYRIMICKNNHTLIEPELCCLDNRAVQQLGRRIGPNSYADITYTVLHFSPYTAFHYLLYTAGTQFRKTIFYSASNFTRNMVLTYHLHMLPIGLIVP